jgi:hypothetical protein
MKTSLISPFILLLLALTSSCTKKQEIDTIITAKKIYTVDSVFRVGQVMAINNDKIVAVGSSAEINAKFNAKTTLDYADKYVYPGFIDPHCHFLGYGQMLQNPWLGGLKSWEEVVQKIVEHQIENPSQWVLGRGWNQTEWDNAEFPTKELLDKHFPDKPVYLTRVDGHCAIVNSKALKLAGIHSKTKIKGGEIEIKNNQPTGLLIDNAKERVRAILPQFTTQEKVRQLLRAQENCFAVGLTSVTDAGVTYENLLLYDSLHQSGQLVMNINTVLDPKPDDIKKVQEIHSTFNPKLSANCIKLYADGALGSRGALLFAPYSDAPHTLGVQVESREFLEQMCKLAHECGLQVATHCIGDKAVNLMLDIYGQFLSPGNNLRWRIEHAQVVHPDDFMRFGKLSVVPSIQTTHATSDMPWAGKRLGERVKYAYAYRQLLEQNGWLPNGSDFPIEDINPLFGFYSGVARKDHQGQPADGFQPENALTRQQALRAMTIWAARADFKENLRGSLETNKIADFVVLDTDLMEAPENQLFKAKVLGTFVDGRIVYKSDN